MITVVSGFGRCGSSLTMQMLVAGGVPATPRATHPFYEDGRDVRLPHDHEWLKECEGRFIKILQPNIRIPPKGLDYRVIWLDRRDLKSQARSWEKFAIQWRGPALNPDKKGRGSIQQDIKFLKKNRPKCLAMWRSRTDQILELVFEDILADPMDAALKLCNFCSIDTTKAADMAAVVVKRKPGNYPGMLERKLKASGPNPTNRGPLGGSKLG